ncbi:MAG: hypothetical protein E3J86_13585 [Candidatus Thorarchaeota archaeon]|nr:MAG: hypothetical protein E3J86_13585 [Candidatus Thorarchaeota archaeon]
MTAIISPYHKPLDPPPATLSMARGDSEFEDILVDCYRSTKLYASIFHSERFYRPFDALHDQIFEIIDDDSIPLAAIAAPRGLGKTSIASIVTPAKKILYNDSGYIVPVSCTYTLAELQSENLKRDLLSSEMVLKVFKPVKSQSFSKEQWIANNDIKTCVMPRGARQQIRGILYGVHRPNLILVDDLEDPEHMDSEDQRKKKREWFFADLFNAVDRGRHDWRIIVLGTVLHEDSLLVELLEDPDWVSVTLSICDDKLNSNAPNFMSTPEVKKLYAGYKRRNQLGTFYREYRNIPVPVETAKFKQEYFKYYGPIEAKGTDYVITEEELNNSRDVTNVILIDPAKTVKEESAECAIVGIGVNTFNRAMFIRDIVHDQFYPDELYLETFLMATRLHAQVIGVEVTGLEEFIMYPLRNAMLMGGYHFTLVELRARGGHEGRGSGKIARVAALSPLYREGLVYHNKTACMPLEAQLLPFPKSKRWDVMDATAYIIELLETGEMYFNHADGDDEDSSEVIEREMAMIGEMDNEPAIEDFRVL